MTTEQKEFHILSKLKYWGIITENNALKESDFIRKIECEKVLSINDIILCKNSLKEKGYIIVTKFNSNDLHWYILATSKGLSALEEDNLIVKIIKWIKNPENIWKIIVVILIPITLFIFKKILKY